MRLSALLLCALGALGVSSAAPTWHSTAPLPRGLGGHAAAATVDDGTLWVAGGSFWQGDVKHIDATVRRLGSDAPTWEPVLTLPRGFAHGGVVQSEGTLWLIGGFDATGPSAALQQLELTNRTAQVPAMLPEPRAYCGAAFLAGALWIVGGTPQDGAWAELPTTCFRYDLARGELQPLSAPGPAIVNPLVLAFGRELHVLPGSIWSAERKRLEAPTEAWIYSLATERWTRRPLPQSLPRGLSGIALDARRALLVGGASLQAGATSLDPRTWLYDAAENRIMPGPALPEPRLAAALASDGRNIWVVGGEDRPRSRATTVWRGTVSSFSSR